MANTYDVYLRKRLTEFDIIIQNLPYRDGLVAHTKMYLDAMLSYLHLQKFIVGSHETELHAEIDDLIEVVMNSYQSEAILKFEAETSAMKPIDIANELVLSIGEVDVDEEVFNTYSDLLQLSTSALQCDVAKSIGEVRPSMVLSTKAGEILDTVFNNFTAKLWLGVMDELNATLIYFVTLNGIDAEMSATAALVLGRLRTLSEIDSLLLSDIDNLSLEELDYIVFA